MRLLILTPSPACSFLPGAPCPLPPLWRSVFDAFFAQYREVGEGLERVFNPPSLQPFFSTFPCPPLFYCLFTDRLTVLLTRQPPHPTTLSLTFSQLFYAPVNVALSLPFPPPCLRPFLSRLDPSPSKPHFQWLVRPVIPDISGAPVFSPFLCNIGTGFLDPGASFFRFFVSESPPCTTRLAFPHPPTR